MQHLCFCLSKFQPLQACPPAGSGGEMRKILTEKGRRKGEEGRRTLSIDRRGREGGREGSIRKMC